MLKKRFNKLNNKAFTLIEILLAISLLAIATIAIGSVIISTQNNASDMFNEAELQQQLAEAQETFHNEILGTTAGVKFWTRDSDTDDFELVYNDDSGEYEKLVAFYSLDTIDYTLAKIYYKYNVENKTLEVAELKQSIEKDPNQKIVLSVDNDVESTLNEIGDKWTLVSNNMETFSLDLTHYENNRLIAFDMEIKQQNTSYPTNDTVYLRNDISVNKDLIIDKYHTVALEKPTLRNSFFTYDKTEHSPTEINYFERYMTRTETSVLTAVNAGTYMITYELKDKISTKWADGSTADVTVTWTINKRAIGLRWGQTSWPYNGSTRSTTCTATNLVGNDSCDVLLRDNEIGPNAGSKTCIAYSVSNPNYKIPENNSTTLTITQILPTFKIRPATRTYNGNAQEMVQYTNLTGGTPRFYISTKKATPTKKQITETSCLATDAGKYYIWYVLLADDSGNYKDSSVCYLGYADMQRSPTASVSARNTVYNGKEQTGVSGKYVKNSGTPSATDAGVYTCYVSPDSNHLWEDGSSTSRPYEWTIYKAQGKVTAPVAKKSLVYNEQPQTLIDAGSTPYGKVYYSLTGQDGSWSTKMPTGTEAQTYTVYYYSAGDSNHYATDQNAYVPVTISRRATAKVSAVNHTYNGRELTGVVGEHIILLDNYSAVNAGNYVATVMPDSNHTWENGKVGTISIPWQIKQNVTTLIAPMAKRNLVYDGTAHQLVYEGGVDCGELLYSLSEDGPYTTSIPTGIEAGTYRVWYYATGDSNQLGTNKEYVDVTIAENPEFNK
jgi:type II secretory pathway component PulJ